MSKYAAEREALGLNSLSASSTLKSKYERERLNPNAYQEKITGYKKQAILEKEMHTPKQAQSQSQAQSKWDNQRQQVASFITAQEAKKSGAPVLSQLENMVLAQPKEALASPMTQFTSGAYEGTLAKTIDKMRQFSGYKPTPAAMTAELSSQYADGWRTAGRLYGSTMQNLALYGTLGKAAEGMDALQGISNPFLRNLAGGQLADTIIQTPGVVIEGALDKKPVGEILKDVGKQQVTDFAYNAAFGVAGEALRAVSDKIKGGKRLAQSATETAGSTAKNAAPIGGESARNVAESMNVPRIKTDAEVPQGRIFGEQPKGEIPEGMKERGFSRNVRTDQAMPDDIRHMFDENLLTYKQISNADTLSKAEKIFSQGEEVATAEFYRSITSKEFKPESVPLAKMLANQANAAGNVAKAREILSATAEKLTEAGQFSQAAKILREADPETFLMTIDKQLRKLNEQGAKQYGKKWVNIDLLPDEITAIQNIPRGNQQAYEEVWEQIGSRIAKDLPSTGMEKFDAWRRIAMLLNPKTHIRNTVGNVIMSGMRKTSDTLGAALEKLAGIKTGERTKSFGWSFNKNIASKVDETWDVVKKDVLGNSRFEIDNLKSLGQEKRIFKNPVLQGLNEFSFKTLNAEDNIFTERAFKDALGQYMQANRLTDATDEAVQYATRRAWEATFKQANMLSDFINRAKQTPGIGRLVEGAIPFSKTPANIAARAVEYSPLGLVKAMYSKASGKTAATVIEDLSKGLTGSAITALGFYLGASGWAKVERHRSSKAESLMQAMGDQANSIMTPLGSYTFDWAQPFAVPLAMGIAAVEAIKNRKDGDTLAQAIWDGIMAGGDTIFNMTMMQNIKDLFSGGSITENIAQIPVSYLEQALPSLFGQVTRTIDPVRRNTYDPNKLRQEWNRVKSRVPGLSQTLEPALDIWGQEQSQGGALQQFINPGYFKERSNDPVTKEIARLYADFQDTDMLPKIAPKSFSDKGKKYTLTPQQLTEFQRKMGQENYNDIKRLISSAEYKKMTDEQKVKKIKRIVSDNYDDVKEDIIKASALKGSK